MTTNQRLVIPLVSDSDIGLAIDDMDFIRIIGITLATTGDGGIVRLALGFGTMPCIGSLFSHCRGHGHEMRHQNQHHHKTQIQAKNIASLAP